MRLKTVFATLMLMSFAHAQESDEVLKLMKDQFMVAEKNMRIMKQCLEGANTLAQANVCEKAFSHITGDESDPFSNWNGELKKEALKDLNYYLDTVAPCIKKAKTLEEVSACTPDNN
jgi:hypothetical protein